jgi:hypothetical protein
VLLAVFFYHPVTKLGGHLLNVTTIDIQLLCDLLIGEVQSHEVQTQDPDFEGLMMSCEDGFSEIIESLPARFAFIALPIGLCIIEASFDDVPGITERALSLLRPAKLTYGIIALGIINQVRYIYLHLLDSSRDVVGGFPFYHNTTLESNMSQDLYPVHPVYPCEYVLMNHGRFFLSCLTSDMSRNGEPIFNPLFL